MDESQRKEVTTIQTSAPEQVIKTTKIVPPTIKTEHPQRVFEKKKAIFRTHQIIWYILGAIEIILGFRMSLKALGADPMGGFTSMIYAISNIFALPFQGIIPSTVSGTSVIEWSTIIAAIVYLIIAYAIIYLLQMLKPVTPQEVSQNIDNV